MYQKIGTITPQKRYNMLTSKQISIFSVFIQNPFKEYSFGEIKEYSNEKSNSVTQNAVKAFLSENMVSEKIGTSKLYSVNSSHLSGKG